MSNLMTDMKSIFPLHGGGMDCSETLEPVVSSADVVGQDRFHGHVIYQIPPN
jgi:hypothetical protein